MITGFNTDIEHDGVVYHVQTEDKGVNSPLILSLVYSGGAILASKRSPYEDLIASGFNEEVLADRLKRQHRLICAAIKAGRIEELKRMGARDGGAETPAEDAVVLPEEVVPAPESELKSSRDVKDLGISKDSPYTVYDSRRMAPLGEVATAEQGLALSILNEEAFCAGEAVTLRILVQKQRTDKLMPVASVELSVKILGTTFRPQIYAAKTGRDGIAEVSVEIPNFSSGRAAILVRAAVDGDSKEIRRVINPAT